MKRKRVYRFKDKKVFRNTADRTKAINMYSPVVMRGGFRL